MTHWIPYGCPEDACKAVQRLPALRDRLGVVSARPWNKHQPRETAWWLVPSDDDGSWPAHRLGKLVFEFGEEPNQLDMGLYIEKGVSAQAAQVLNCPKGHVLGDDWMWTPFVADLRVGAVTSLLRSMSRDIDLDVYLAFVLKPQTSAGSPGIEGDVAAFSIKREGFLVPELDPPSSKLLRPFRSVTTEAELVSALEQVNGFTWVDAYVTATLECGTEPTSAEVWTAERMWGEVLAPLSRWAGRR